MLSLNSALVSDTGRYTCVAVNAGGEQQREYDLKVYGKGKKSSSQILGIVLCLFVFMDRKNEGCQGM